MKRKSPVSGYIQQPCSQLKWKFLSLEFVANVCLISDNKLTEPITHSMWNVYQRLFLFGDDYNFANICGLEICVASLTLKYFHLSQNQ